MHLRRGTMFRINTVGSRILDLLEQDAARAEIVEQLSREFDVAREIVRADITEFIECLRAHGVVDARAGEHELEQETHRGTSERA
jgi:hypothetical protein